MLTFLNHLYYSLENKLSNIFKSKAGTTELSLFIYKK